MLSLSFVVLHGYCGERDWGRLVVETQKTSNSKLQEASTDERTRKIYLQSRLEVPQQYE